MVCTYWMTLYQYIKYISEVRFAITNGAYMYKAKRDEHLQLKRQYNVSLDISHEIEVLQNSSLQKHGENLTSILLKENKTNELNLYKTQSVTYKKTYICAEWDVGRLGNKLFTYASLYGIAKKTNTTFVIEENAEIRKYFKYLKAEIIPKDSTICKNMTYVDERAHCCSFDPGIYNFPENRNIKQKFYLQSYYYFKDVEDEIRKQFTFKDEIVINARRRILKALSDYGHNHSNSEIVGIHVRMGEKLEEGPVTQGNVVASKEFYNRAINYFRTKLKNPVFLIVTSWHKEKDIKWVKQHVTGNDVVFLGSNPVEVDLCALTLCNHTIMNIGTFGWWGAWLCNGTTIYYKDFAAKGRNLDAMYSKELKIHFPPTWIGM